MNLYNRVLWIDELIVQSAHFLKVGHSRMDCAVEQVQAVINDIWEGLTKHTTLTLTKV